MTAHGKDGEQTDQGLRLGTEAGVDADRPSRRDLLMRAAALGVSAAAFGTAFPVAGAALADEAVAARSDQFKAAYEALVGERKLTEGAVTMTLPDMAENGNMVPFTVYAPLESPPGIDDYVTKLTIFSTANPQPVIATFGFTRLSGRAEVSGRLRLAKTQDVIAIAETSKGELLAGHTIVKVTVGGCGG